MNQNAIRITAAGIAIAAVAVISLATETRDSLAARPIDPSVPAAWEILHDNDGRGQGNVEDKTY